MFRSLADMAKRAGMALAITGTVALGLYETGVQANGPKTVKHDPINYAALAAEAKKEDSRVRLFLTFDEMPTQKIKTEDAEVVVGAVEDLTFYKHKTRIYADPGIKKNSGLPTLVPSMPGRGKAIHVEGEQKGKVYALVNDEEAVSPILADLPLPAEVSFRLLLAGPFEDDGKVYRTVPVMGDQMNESYQKDGKTILLPGFGFGVLSGKNGDHKAEEFIHGIKNPFMALTYGSTWVPASGGSGIGRDKETGKDETRKSKASAFPTGEIKPTDIGKFVTWLYQFTPEGEDRMTIKVYRSPAGKDTLYQVHELRDAPRFGPTQKPLLLFAEEGGGERYPGLIKKGITVDDIVIIAGGAGK